MEMYCQKSRCAPELIVIECRCIQLATSEFTGTLETCKMDATKETAERIIREHFRPSDTFHSVLQIFGN